VEEVIDRNWVLGCVGLWSRGEGRGSIIHVQVVCKDECIDEGLYLTIAAADLRNISPSCISFHDSTSWKNQETRESKRQYDWLHSHIIEYLAAGTMVDMADRIYNS
jgi:hypothetical protein